MFVIHEKGNYITTSTAAKTMVKALVWSDAKGGRFLSVEGTTSPVILPFFLEGNILGYDRCNVIGINDLLF